MCGRFALTTPAQDLAKIFDLWEVPPLVPRYNIAPSQEVAVIRTDDDHRRLDLLRWGLIPSWAKDPAIGYKTFNARCETAHEKPSFKAAFKKRRCLVPASGFYEWERFGSTKQPYYIQRIDGKPLAMAGLWEAWSDRVSGEAVESCTILTTCANGLISTIHERMPVILDLEGCDLWLDGPDQDLTVVQKLFAPVPENILQMEAVSDYVNKAGHEGPECVEPKT